MRGRKLLMYDSMASEKTHQMTILKNIRDYLEAKTERKIPWVLEIAKVQYLKSCFGSIQIPVVCVIE